MILKSNGKPKTQKKSDSKIYCKFFVKVIKNNLTYRRNWVRVKESNDIRTSELL